MKTAIFIGKNPTELNGYRSDELALAKIQNTKVWLEAESRMFNSAKKSIFDRASNKWIDALALSPASKLDVKFLVPADNATINQSSYRLTTGVVGDITATFVVKVLQDETCIVLSRQGDDAATLPIIIGFTADKKISVWDKVFFPRLNVTSDAIKNALQIGKTAVITATVSQYGITVWLNGVKVGENKNDKRGINSDKLALPGDRGVGTGHIIIHSKDLSLDENLAEMGLLQQTLLDYYGINKLVF